MSGSCFADVLKHWIVLAPDEQQALDRLEERERAIRKGMTLQRSDEPVNELFVLKRGLFMSFRLLDDGSRQILRFYFPGDLMGMASLAYRNAPESLCALSDSVVCPFEKGLMSQLAVDHPRLATMILMLGQIERVVLTDRLASLGRTSAKARVGALLLDLRNRMLTTSGATDDGSSFAIGLTQEEIGDATGLTSVHVNRMLRQLDEEGLIAREGGRVTIRDAAALVRATDYIDRYAGLDLSWLPPGR